MLFAARLLRAITLELGDLLLERLLLGEGISQSSVVRGNLCEGAVDHLLDEEFAIAKSTDCPSYLDLPSTLVKLYLP